MQMLARYRLSKGTLLLLLIHSGLFLAGFLYRMWLIGLVPQYSEFDQREYHEFAENILEQGVAASSFRLYGYPVLLALLYTLFGTEHAYAWQIPQAIFDTLAGYILFRTGRIIFQKPHVAWFSYVLYLFNPYTAGYAGVRLTEGLATVLTACLFFLIAWVVQRKSWPGALLCAFLLGYLAQVRPSYLYFSIVCWCGLIAAIRIYTKPSIPAIPVGMALACCYVVPFLYTIAGNMIHYGQFSLVPVDNLFVREFYISLYILNSDTLGYIPSEVNTLYTEYSRFYTAEQRKAITNKYVTKAVDKVRQDPKAFIVSRFQKMWFVWEKRSFYVYYHPDNPFYIPVVYWLNNGLLLLSTMGYIVWAVKEAVFSDPVKKYIAWLSILLVLYMTVLHAFAMTSGRFSIPAYPVIILFAGFGLSVLYSTFVSRSVTSIRG